MHAKYRSLNKKLGCSTPVTKSSVSFDLDNLESPNRCQNLGFFILFPLSNMRLAYDVRNIRKTRAERQT